MFRWLKILPLMLAVAALSVFTTSCGTTNLAQIRVVNAIPDGQPVDVYFNGTRTFKDLSFDTVQPNTSPANYITITPGSETMQSFPPGDSTDPISPSGVFSLNGSTQYTVVGVGLALSDSPPLVLTDNNTVPTSGNVEFRIINASPNSPAGGVDVYIVPPGTDITDYTPQISALGYGQGSIYQSVPFLSSGYAVIVTAYLKKTALISQPFTSQSESITTVVLVDNQGGNNGMSQTPLVLNDLN